MRAIIGICPVCGYRKRVQIRSGLMGAHKIGTNRNNCPASNLQPPIKITNQFTYYPRG